MNPSVPYNEKELINRLKEGDIQSFELLFRSHNKRLYAFALRYVKVNEDAEGIVQEVFLKIWQHRLRLDETLSLNSYLFRITKNLITDHFRKKQKEIIYGNYIRNLIEISKNNAQINIFIDEKNKSLADAIRNLPEKRRIVFLLSKKFGLSRNEIANFLNISENTVRNQLSQAIQALRKIIPKEILTFFLLL